MFLWVEILLPIMTHGLRSDKKAKMKLWFATSVTQFVFDFMPDFTTSSSSSSCPQGRALLMYTLQPCTYFVDNIKAHDFVRNDEPWAVPYTASELLETDRIAAIYTGKY